MHMLDLEKAKEPGIKLPLDHTKGKVIKKKKKSASLTMLKPLTAWITTNCGKF